MAKKGDRVGAICGTKDGIIEFFGLGIYEGDEVPPAGVEFMGMDLAEIGVSNPKIKLDNGDTVWGCQCWWGTEAAVKKRLEGKTIRVVRIADKIAENKSQNSLDKSQKV